MVIPSAKEPQAPSLNGYWRKGVVARLGELDLLGLLRVLCHHSPADPAAVDYWGRCDRASVSGQVKSHAKYLPQDQGSSIAPSGRLSSRKRREGSSSV
jgi:hypothetical protein